MSGHLVTLGLDVRGPRVTFGSSWVAQLFLDQTMNFNRLQLF
jgi:hypothetical protein